MQRKTAITFGLVVIMMVTFLSSTTAHAIGVLESRQERDSKADSSIGDNHTTTQIKDLVQDEFGDNHPMVAVARCESSFRQFADGEVLRNPTSDAIGIFQILEGLHEDPAEQLGVDIFTAEGNIAYARKLYDSFGLAPWSPSSLCWDDGGIGTTNPQNVKVQQKQSTRVPVKVRSDGELESLFGGEENKENEEQQEPVDDPVITKKLVSGVRDPQVRTLQRLLNDIGYQLADSGPGSPGEETDFFGAKTRAAVQEFQCQQDIVCSGGRYTTGYGLVDAKTRQVLNKLASERRAGVYRIGKLRVRTADANPESVEGQQDRRKKQNPQNSEDSTESETRALQKELNRLRALVNGLQNQLDR